WRQSADVSHTKAGAAAKRRPQSVRALEQMPAGFASEIGLRTRDLDRVPHRPSALIDLQIRSAGQPEAPGARSARGGLEGGGRRRAKARPRAGFDIARVEVDGPRPAGKRTG